MDLDTEINEITVFLDEDQIGLLKQGDCFDLYGLIFFNVKCKME